MDTSANVANASVTQTSSLFVENREVPGMGPGRAHGGTLCGQLTGSVAGIGPKNTCASTGVLFIGWDYREWDTRDDIRGVVKLHMPSARSLG